MKLDKKWFDRISEPGVGVIAGKLIRAQEEEAAIALGLEAIHDERVKQVQKLWDWKLDDHYTNGELLLFSQYWLTRVEDKGRREELTYILDYEYGFHPSAFGYDRHTPLERATIGGALASAEIDRLLRASNNPPS